MTTLSIKSIDMLNMLNAGFEQEIERMILERLKTHAAAMLEEMAKDMAKGLKGNIVHYNRAYENDVQIILKLDGIEALRV